MSVGTNRTANNCHKELSSNRHAVCMGVTLLTYHVKYALQVFSLQCVQDRGTGYNRITIGYFMGSKKLWPHSVSQVETRGFYVVIIDAIVSRDLTLWMKCLGTGIVNEMPTCQEKILVFDRYHNILKSTTKQSRLIQANKPVINP